MSDLWGVRDYVLKHYPHFRYCSYDMPGTGWSDPLVSNQPDITERVMAELGETGPFIVIGSLFCHCSNASCYIVRDWSDHRRRE